MASVCMHWFCAGIAFGMAAMMAAGNTVENTWGNPVRMLALFCVLVLFVWSAAEGVRGLRQQRSEAVD